MEVLPCDIILEIKQYLHPTTLYTTNKSYFNKYYIGIIKKYTIKDREFKNYVLNIVKKNCIFQFNIILDVKFSEWLHTRRWIFKNTTYFNYLEFLKYLCIENNSNKCLELINNSLNTKNKKIYKNRSKTILWRN